MFLFKSLLDFFILLYIYLNLIFFHLGHYECAYEYDRLSSTAESRVSISPHSFIISLFSPKTIFAIKLSQLPLYTSSFLRSLAFILPYLLILQKQLDELAKTREVVDLRSLDVNKFG